MDKKIKINFLQGDPLIYLLIFKLRLAYYLIPLIMVLFATALFFVYANIVGVFNTIYEPVTNKILSIGTLDSPGHLMIAFLVQPSLVWYYLSFNKLAWETFEGLASTNVIPKDHLSGYEEELTRTSEKINNKWILVFGLLVGTVTSVAITSLAFNLSEGPYWLHQMRWLFLMTETPLAFITSYATSITILRIVIFHLGLSLIYKRIPTQLHPLHEDGAGGYAAVGKVVGSYFTLAFSGFSFYLASAISHIQNSPGNTIPNYLLFQLLLLPLSAIFIFFVPLLSTHKEMQEAIRRNLARFSRKYNEMEINILSQKSACSEEQINELNGIIDLAKKISSISPAWPFNSQIFNRFLATLGTSFIPITFTLLEKYTIQFITP